MISVQTDLVHIQVAGIIVNHADDLLKLFALEFVVQKQQWVFKKIVLKPSV